MPGRPVAARANFIAASVDSAPEFAENTLSRCGTSATSRNQRRKPLGQNARQRRNIHLHQVRQIRVEHALQRGTNRGMVAAEGKNAEAAHQIEVADNLAVIEILSASLAKSHIIPDGP